MARSLIILLAVLALASAGVAQPAQPGAPAGAADARPVRSNPVTSIQEVVRLEGYAKTPLRGIGIVVGLRGTGDSGQELLLARPLAKWYENNGNPLGDLRELAKSKSAAIVTISCEVPEGGGRSGDTIDVFVQASHTAASLKGGTLILSPLLAPSAVPADRLQEAVYGFASGPLTIEDGEVPTSGRIRLGAQLARDIRPRPIGDQVNLIIKPYYRSFATAETIAGEINGIVADLENTDTTADIAKALDDTTVRVLIPQHERTNTAGFLASIMSKRFSPSLLDLPAMVVVNERTGSIVVTGDVEISAVTVGSDRLIVTTTTPAPTPTPTDPLVRRDNWIEFGSTGSSGERARITDLLEAFKQLNVPVKEQIAILSQIDRAGRLHGKLIRE
jgi:flagellar P-ring protein FlgI